MGILVHLQYLLLYQESLGVVVVLMRYKKVNESDSLSHLHNLKLLLNHRRKAMIPSSQFERYKLTNNKRIKTIEHPQESSTLDSLRVE